jgi:hypothetical protein
MKVILFFTAEIIVLFSTKNCSMSFTNHIQNAQVMEAAIRCKTTSRRVGLEREFFDFFSIVCKINFYLFRNAIQVYLKQCPECELKKARVRKSVQQTKLKGPDCSNKPNERVQIDLIDMQAQSDNEFRWIFVYQVGFYYFFFVLLLCCIFDFFTLLFVVD